MLTIKYITAISLIILLEGFTAKELGFYEVTTKRCRSRGRPRWSFGHLAAMTCERRNKPRGQARHLQPPSLLSSIQATKDSVASLRLQPCLSHSSAPPLFAPLCELQHQQVPEKPGWRAQLLSEAKLRFLTFHVRNNWYINKVHGTLRAF